MSRLKLVGIPVLFVALILAMTQVPRLVHAQARPGARPIHAPATTAQGTTCSPSAWRVVPSADPSNATNALYGVAAVSSSNVWAVGNQSGTAGFSSKSLIEHWNGSAWSAVSNPNVGTAFNDLYGVAAISSSDIWAVGDYWDQTINDTQTLAEHWNGAAWQVVPTPDVTQFDNQLVSVAAVASNDVWAVGAYSNSGGALIEHWDGTHWTVAASPSIGIGSSLSGVVAISANNVWAVGTYAPPSGGGWQTLIEQWNGASWQVVPSPDANTASNYLNSVAAISANDIWAVGSFASQSGNSSALAEHWNGTSWSVVSIPAPIGAAFLYAVTAASSTDVWAGGEFPISTTADAPYFEHWNGSAWTVVRSPSIASATYPIRGMVAVSGRDVWAVGSDSPSSGPGQTLVERYTTPMLGIPCGR